MDDDRRSIRTQVAADLKDVLSGDIWADALGLAMYSTDASIYQIDPLCVVLPADRQDVEKVVDYAARQQMSIIARGAGSGLAGESIGSGIIVDFSRFMNRLVKLNLEASEVTVEPGVVLDQLNRQLAVHGKQFGPDPASGNRATIGGMIGNNATGAHSLKYGYTGNHLRSVSAVSASAESIRLSRSGGARSAADGTVGRWGERLQQLLESHKQLMAKVRPKTDRNGSGYNVYAASQNGSVNLPEMLAGSEGTLALVTEATLGLVDLPAVKAVLQLNFASLGAMALAVPHILELAPSACELMDETLLAMARQAYPRYHDVLPSGVAASLLVEFDGADEATVAEKLRLAQLHAEQLPANARPVDTMQITSADLQGRVWAARKAAVPLLFRNKGPAQPIPIIEDIAVNAEQLAEYLDGLTDITARLGVPMAYYAHAGHGELHTRPFLDLHKPDEVKKLKELADEVFKLVWSLGGTISGEHGEGLVRVSFIKQQYGPEMYELFRQIKKTFDPDNLLNPGKIINDDPDVMVKNLRFSHRPIRQVSPRNLVFHDNELTTEIEQCNGNGLCRSSDPLLSMCPMYRATGDERASPRAKANLMRHWLYGLLDEDIMQTDEFKEIADLCIGCRMCALECPSLVNIPKLMLEAKAEYVKAHGPTRSQLVLTRSEFMSRMGSAFGPLANLFGRAGWFRKLLQKATDLDWRRPMPRFGFGSNLPKLRRHIRRQGALDKPIDKVAYFVDVYATYNDHELGRAVVDVLRHNNVEVIICDQLGAAMPAICYGALNHARKTIDYNVQRLAEAVRQGYKVVCSEPTAALCLKEEYLDIISAPEAQLVADSTYEVTAYLSQLNEQGRLRTDFSANKGRFSSPMKLAYHVPCHYQALKIADGTASLLQMIESVQVEHLPNSCCGLAGTFGFQSKKFDLSMRVGEPMLAPLRASEADYGLTECATCKMQMELASGKTVLHPVKVLAGAYGLL